jgi:hypothetical protein
MESDMKIGLHYSNTLNNNGPGKVATNLIAGLNELNIEVISNEICEFNGVLQANCKHIHNCPENSFIGPNISVLPIEVPNIWNQYKKFNVPCNWVYDLYKSFSITQNKQLYVWPVGIDTKKFCNFNYTPIYDVLIYSKNTKEKLPTIIEHFNKIGLSFCILIYGEYTENEFIEKVNKSKCVCLLTKTESQGIAYQEILSMNKPCFVIEKNVWDDYGLQVPASSVPYFDSMCGVVSNDINEFELFYNNLNKFSPREYIVNNLSLVKQASKYIDYVKD